MKLNVKRRSWVSIVSLTWLFLFLFVAFTLNISLVYTEESVVNENSGQDWSGFWQLFNQQTVWDIEYYNGVSWVSMKSLLDVIRDYPEPNHCKITLNFTSQDAGSYRLTFAINKKVKNYINKTAQYCYDLSFAEYNVSFNWTDLMSIPQLILRHGIKDNMFWFRIIRNNVPANYNLVIDPSIVATVGTNVYGHGFQRKTFHAEDYFFQFYGNSSLKINYKSSSNGDTWGSETYFRDGTCAQFSLWFDGTYVHTVYAVASYGGTIYYRRGNPQSDGTISWDTEQTVYSSTGWMAWEPTIAVDSSNYPYVFTHWEKGSDYNRLVIKSDNNDGTWSTTSGYPMNLTQHDAEPIPGVILPLTSGKMYVIWSPYEAGANYYGRLFNGSDWEANVTICSTDYHDIEFFSTVSNGDDIHMVFWNRTNSEQPYDSYIRYVNYTSGSWGNVENVLSIEGIKAISIEDADTEFFVYYNYLDEVYKTRYLRGTSGSWGSGTQIIWSENPVSSGTELTSFRENWEGYHSCTALTNEGSEKLEMWSDGPPVNDACDSTSTFYVNSYGWVNVTISDIDYVVDFKTVDVQVNTTGDAETFTLRWTQATDVFSEVSDSSGICTLDAVTSARVNVDGDTDKIAFYFKFTGGTDGVCDVQAITTDDSDLTDTDFYASEFTLASNQVPTIGTFQAPATAYATEYFFLNCTVQDLNGKGEIVNATIEITNSIILKYDNATDTFSEYQDANSYCTVDVANCVRTEVNATAFKLCWKTKLSYSCPEGQISVVVTNTLVYDLLDASGSGSQADLFYFDKKFNLNLRSVDSENNAITDVTVYMDNGTEYSQSPSNQGWANWTGLTAASVDVQVWFHNVAVNSTTITMDNDKTLNLTCTAYPFTLDAATYHAASNATISSASWNSTTRLLVISFSGAVDTYILDVDTAEPTYVLNCTYDLDDYTSFLELTHYGNATITIAYPNWATTYIYRSDNRITSIYWSEEKLYITLTGTTGTNGTLEIHCGSRGTPQATTGLTDTVYFSATTILAGTYSFSSTVTASLDWTESGGGGGGGSTPGPSIFLSAETIDVGIIQQGTSKTFNATASWTGAASITITDLTFTGEGSEWLRYTLSMPYTVQRLAIETTGSINIPITLAVPSQAKLGDYKVLVTYEIQVGTNVYETTANIMWTVTSTPVPPGGIAQTVSILLLISLVGIIVASIKKKR